MIVAVGVHGTRGDVEPCAAVAVELKRRGHEVRMAVPPDLVGFVESVGLAPAAAYGVESQKQVESEVFRQWWKMRNPLSAIAKAREYLTDGWQQMSATLHSLSEDADLIVGGSTYQDVALNVAESRALPLAVLQYFPMRAISHVLPVRLPSAVANSAANIAEWAYWRLGKPAEDTQRRDLGLPEAAVRSMRRIIDRGTLEIQAYDAALFPGLLEEWRGMRPFVGSLSLALPTEFDNEIGHWISAGEPPIYFGFGSTPVDSPAALLEMIESVCAELGARALICASAWNPADLRVASTNKVVPAVNLPEVFPRCRAVVHHGGAGTLAAGIRAGAPTVALWSVADQPLWARRAEAMGVGRARRFSKTNRTTLLSDLRAVLAPECIARTRELAKRMIDPSDGAVMAADLLEDYVRRPAQR